MMALFASVDIACLLLLARFETGSMCHSESRRTRCPSEPPRGFSFSPMVTRRSEIPRATCSSLGMTPLTHAALKRLLLCTWQTPAHADLGGSISVVVLLLL